MGAIFVKNIQGHFSKIIQSTFYRSESKIIFNRVRTDDPRILSENYDI